MSKNLVKLEDLREAFARLKEGMAEASDQLGMDGVLQRFEFTYELAWKVMQEYAKYKGVRVASPRDALRVAGDLGLVESVEEWMHYLEERNKTAHVYDVKMAQGIYAGLPRFVKLVEGLLKGLEEELRS